MNNTVLKRKKIESREIFFLIVYFAIFIILLTGLNERCKKYASELILLFFSYFMIGTIISLICVIRGMDIFEPFVLSTILMVAIFIVMPIVDISNGDTRAFGVDVMPYCFEGTIIFDLSYVAFCVGYFKKRKRAKTQRQDFVISENSRQIIVLVVLVLYVICYAFALIDQMTHGINWEYILSFGSTELVGGATVGQPLGFLGLFANSLLSCWLIYLYYGKLTLLKVLLGILTFAMYFIRTARHIMIDMAVAPIVMYYLSKDKRPSIFLIVVSLLLVVVGSGMIAFIRGAVRNGWDLSLQGMGSEDIFENFVFNLQIYKSYYGVLRAFTEKMDYTYGMQVLYTFIMIIPRIIWPGKPESYQAAIIGNGLNHRAVITGYAFPNLGEFYGEFGVVGAVSGYLLFGLLLGHWKTMYDKESATKVSMLKYSILLPVCLQLIIRGAIYQNFYLVVFLMLPFWAVDIACNVLQGRRFK